MEQIISVEQIISLVPEQDRSWCVIGIAAIAVLFAATGLIQWWRAKRLWSQCDDGPQLRKRLMWLDWPLPIALLTLLLVLGMARGVAWPLKTLLAMAGFAAGCLLEVVVASGPMAGQSPGTNRSKCSNKEARNGRGATLVFPSSSRGTVEGPDGLEGKRSSPAAPLSEMSSGRSAAASGAEIAWRD